MKVALIHDYLIEYGGAERVLEALHQIYPDSDVYVAYYDSKGLGEHAKRFKDWKIKTTWIQHIPGSRRFISAFRILAPMAYESLNLNQYDLVISSSNIYFAKAVITKPETLHLGYIHTPPRYLYGYTTSFNYKKHWWIRIPAELINHILRVYDFETSKRPDVLIANSKVVATRIKKFYRRDAEIVYPPVDIAEFKNAKKQVGDYYLSLSRLWKGKGVDLVVKAATELKLPLKVVGTGPELETLKSLAGPTVEFVGGVSDTERVTLMASAKALIVAAEEEDFGITVVESMAAGTPVIALKSGGYLETIVDGKTGIFFDKPTVISLNEVLSKFEPKKLKAEDCRKQADKFSLKLFKSHIQELVKKYSK